MDQKFRIDKQSATGIADASNSLPTTKTCVRCFEGREKKNQLTIRGLEVPMYKMCQRESMPRYSTEYLQE